VLLFKDHEIGNHGEIGIFSMYKWNPEDYEKSSDAQLSWAKELLQKLKLKGDEKVLDIGSGNGRVTAEISKKLMHGSILGIDSSKDMVIYAEKKYPPNQFRNLRFELMNVEDMDFEKGFDVIFSNATLHWVTDHRNILNRIKKSLKPKGRVLLQMGGKGNASEVLEIADRMINEIKWKKHFTDFAFSYGFYNVEDYQKWVSQAGLKAKSIKLIPKDMTQKGREGLASWIRTTWLPYTQRVSEHLRDDFINEMVDRYIRKHPLDSEGLAHVKMFRLEVSAVNAGEQEK
jgi:trans-aconitate 2-methyltransferase